MNLTAYYTDLWNDSVYKISKGKYETDSMIDSMSDRRRGLTLLAYPSFEVKQNILSFLKELQKIEPEQYYYPVSDMHLTILSVISCSENFCLKQINVQDYVSVIQKGIDDKKSFLVQFRGITISPSCVMIQGFPEDDTLNDIRNSVREEIKKSELFQTMDTRYFLQTAHSTVMRFRKPLSNVDAFVRLLECYRDFDFGLSKFTSFSFVCNDWYQRKSQVNKLYSYNLKD